MRDDRCVTPLKSTPTYPRVSIVSAIVNPRLRCQKRLKSFSNIENNLLLFLIKIFLAMLLSVRVYQSISLDIRIGILSFDTVLTYGISRMNTLVKLCYLFTSTAM